MSIDSLDELTFDVWDHLGHANVNERLLFHPLGVKHKQQHVQIRLGRDTVIKVKIEG